MKDQEKFEKLLKEALKIEMTPEQIIQQKISWVYGNCSLSNPDITWEMVERIVRRDEARKASK